MYTEMVNEKSILSAITAGNEQAFTKLYQYYHQKVYGYALQVLKDESLAQEVVQDVFMKLWIRRAQLTGIDNFGPYLAVCTRNVTLNAIKKAIIQQKHYKVVQSTQTELDLDTINAIRLKDTQKILGRAVDRLSPQQKRVYSLLNIEGLKINDVAEHLNITPSTAKTHLKSALRNIRSFLVVHYRTLGAFLVMFQNIF